MKLSIIALFIKFLKYVRCGFSVYIHALTVFECGTVHSRRSNHLHPSICTSDDVVEILDDSVFTQVKQFHLEEYWPQLLLFESVAFCVG